MQKLILIATLISVAAAGHLGYGHGLGYGFQAGGYAGGYGYGGGYGHGHGHGHGVSDVRVHQSPHSYNFGVQTHGHSSSSYIHQGANTHHAVPVVVPVVAHGHGYGAYGHGGGGFGY